jgi:predicted Zn-dependent protease
MSYSRDHEREADDAAIRIMKLSNINPADLALFFERAEKMAEEKTKPKAGDDNQTKDTWRVPDLFRSHPSSEERMAKLRSAGQ